MATGRKNLLWRSVLLGGGMSLLLKVLLLHLVERVSVVVKDTMQFTQHPPLRHHQQRVQLNPQDGASLPDDLVDVVGICCSQPAAPAQQTKEDGTGYRLVEHPQHDVTYIEGPEPPQEI